MRKKWKRGMVTALSMALVVSNCAPAMAAQGWQFDGKGWYYENTDGSYDYNAWKFVDGEGWYHMDHSGYMQKGWIKDASGKWFYLNPSADGRQGVMKTGWVKDANGKWYYMNQKVDGSNGAMVTGWFQDTDGKWYYLDPVNGDMKTGYAIVDGQVWTLNADGSWNGSSSRPVVSNKSSGRSSSSSSSTVRDYVYDTVNKRLTINKAGTYDFGALTLAGEVVELNISSSVGEGDVEISNLKVTGTTTISGGGSNSVHFGAGVELKDVVTNKVSSKVRVAFDAGATVTGSVKTTRQPVQFDVAAGVTLPSVEASSAVDLSGAGTVGTVAVSTDEPVNISVSSVTNVDVNIADAVTTITGTVVENVNVLEAATGATIGVSGGSVGNIKVEAAGSVMSVNNADIARVEVAATAAGAGISLTGTTNVKSVEVAGTVEVKVEAQEGTTIDKVTADNPNASIKIEGAGTVASYYKVTLNAGGASWKDIEGNIVEDAEKIVQIKDGKTIAAAIDAAVADLVYEGYFFSGWYTDKDCTDGNQVDKTKTEAITLYAKWTQKQVEITTANITGSAIVGNTLTAETNDDATGVITYEWYRSETDSDDELGTEIVGVRASEYELTAADAGKYIQVKISGANNSSKVAVSEKVTANVTEARIVYEDGNPATSVTSGTKLTAVANDEATGIKRYQWMSSDAEDGTYHDIEGATSETYTAEGSTEKVRYIKVAIFGDNDSEAVSEAVAIEKIPAVVVVSQAAITVDGREVAEVSTGDTLGVVTNEGVTVEKTYRWEIFNGGEWITLAETESYTMTGEEEGTEIRVLVNNVPSSSVSIRTVPAELVIDSVDFVVATGSGVTVTSGSSITVNDKSVTLNVTGSAITVSGTSIQVDGQDVTLANVVVTAAGSNGGIMNPGKWAGSSSPIQTGQSYSLEFDPQNSTLYKKVTIAVTFTVE